MKLLILTLIATAFNTAKAQQRGLNFAVTTVIKDYLEIKNGLIANNVKRWPCCKNPLLWAADKKMSKDGTVKEILPVDPIKK